MNSGQTPSPQKDSGEPFSWKFRTLRMNSGQSPSLQTLQLKIKANSSTENCGQLLEWIQANQPPGKIQVNPSAGKLRF